MSSKVITKKKDVDYVPQLLLLFTFFATLLKQFKDWIMYLLTDFIGHYRRKNCSKNTTENKNLKFLVEVISLSET